MDTPGIHEPRHKLGEFLNQEARDSLDDVDAVIWLVDTSGEPTPDDIRIAALLDHVPPKVPVHTRRQ